MNMYFGSRLPWSSFSLFVGIALAAVQMSAWAETAYERELQQLVEQRDRALSAATAPIQARFRASVEQLLRRATQNSDLEAANKIKAALDGATETPTGAVKNARTQLAGTTWQCVPGMPVRPGLAPSLTFTEKTVEPISLKYEADRANTVIIFFRFGDTQAMSLAKGGTRLQFKFNNVEHAYELVPK